MAFAAQSHGKQEQLLDRPNYCRTPSYSATFQSESAKSWVIADLTDLMDKIKHCTCHLNGSPCRLGHDKHHLFGLIGHLLQEDLHKCGRTRRGLTRQESVDSLYPLQSNRPSLNGLCKIFFGRICRPVSIKQDCKATQLALCLRKSHGTSMNAKLLYLSE